MLYIFKFKFTTNSIYFRKLAPIQPRTSSPKVWPACPPLTSPGSNEQPRKPSSCDLSAASFCFTVYISSSIATIQNRLDITNSISERLNFESININNNRENIQQSLISRWGSSSDGHLYDFVKRLIVALHYYKTIHVASWFKDCPNFST